ncbi:MAG: fused MFS/spermidine synthase, partial [Planctomycetes bacterium]|nr:fused MFS/spermidine synthase [Planctomycetota bacterium]
PPIALVAALFFASGATGLVYEVVWSRHLQLLFGVSTFAIATVVTAYMAGLALGSALLGRVADRLSARGAVAAYGLLEIGIGLFAFASFPLLGALERAYLGFAGALLEAPGLRLAVNFVLTFVLLLIPTTLMGGTLPLIARVFGAAAGQTGKGFGWAYALNTAGAVLGTFLAGFVLLERLGTHASAWLVGGVNLAVGGVALAGRWREMRAAPGTEAAAAGDESAPGAVREPRGVLLVLAALCGLVGMGCQIAWVRGFATLLVSTTYTFSLVLMVFLVGIALGSVLAARRAPTPGRLRNVLLLFAASALLQLVLYDTLHELGFRLARTGWSHGLFLLAQFGLAGLVVLPLTLCSGAATTLLVGLASRGLARTGRDVGAVYVANTVGAVLGMGLGGFVLVPWLGAEGTARLLAVALLAGALLLGVSGPRGVLLPLAALAAAVLWPSPDPRRQAFGPVWLANAYRGPSGEPLERMLGFEVIELRHGRLADVAVSLAPSTSERSLWISGMSNASSLGDMPTQANLAILPWLFAPRVAESLHVGLGSGITAGIAASLPGTGRTTVVELEGELFALAGMFAPQTFGLATNPKVRAIADDARTWIALAPPASLDLIVSQPSQIWAKGNGNLFTAEFFAAARRALHADGVFATWIMAYTVPGEVWGIAVATLLDAFPYVLAFRSRELPGDVLFLAAQRPLRLDPTRVSELQRLGGAAAGLARLLGYAQPADVARHFFADQDDLRRATQAIAERHTDARPVLEYLYPRYLLHPRDNELLERLWRERHSAQRPGGFRRPPGADTGELAPATRFAMARETDVDPLPLFADRPLAALDPAGVGGMPAAALPFAFALAADAGQEAVARACLARLGEGWHGAPEVIETLLRHVPRLRAAPWRDELLRRAAAPGPDTGLHTALARLEALSTAAAGGDAAATRAYLDTFLAVFPPERLVVDGVPAWYFGPLVAGALATGRMGAVEEYLGRVDRLFAGRHVGARLALAAIFAQTGRREGARAWLAPYAQWRIEDAQLREVRELVERAR